MITRFLLAIAGCFWGLFCELLGSLPSLPKAITDVIDWGIDDFFKYSNLTGLFIDLDYLKVIIPFFITFYNWDRIVIVFNTVMRKIPFIHWH